MVEKVYREIVKREKRAKRPRFETFFGCSIRYTGTVSSMVVKGLYRAVVFPVRGYVSSTHLPLHTLHVSRILLAFFFVSAPPFLIGTTQTNPPFDLTTTRSTHPKPAPPNPNNPRTSWSPTPPASPHSHPPSPLKPPVPPSQSTRHHYSPNAPRQPPAYSPHRSKSSHPPKP